MIKQLLLASLLILGCAPDDSQNAAQVYSLTDGSRIDLMAPGKLVIINYWATWCAPCRREVPELNKLLQEYGDSLYIVGVNFDGSQGDSLQAEIAKLGIEFPNLLRDPRQLWGLDAVEVLPETLVIGGNGQLLHRLVGPQDKASLEALF